MGQCLQPPRNWPFRLAASRIRESRYREPALGSVGSGLSVVATIKWILLATVVQAVISEV